MPAKPVRRPGTGECWLVPPRTRIRGNAKYFPNEKIKRCLRICILLLGKNKVPVLLAAWLTACRIRWLVSGHPGGAGSRKFNSNSSRAPHPAIRQLRRLETSWHRGKSAYQPHQHAVSRMQTSSGPFSCYWRSLGKRRFPTRPLAGLCPPRAPYRRRRSSRAPPLPCPVALRSPRSAIFRDFNSKVSVICIHGREAKYYNPACVRHAVWQIPSIPF